MLKTQISDALPDIIHDHGIWLPTNHAVKVIAKKRGIPFVVHPRGMLEPWALSFRAYKKKLAWSLYQKRDLESASLFFATSTTEADNLRQLGFSQPIAVIHNGVDIPEVNFSCSSSQTVKQTRTLVFMSRIHPKKGIKHLLEAWRQLQPVNWKLILAGPDEDGHLQEVLDYAEKLGVSDQVEYQGIVDDDSKAKLLCAADLFILPSFSENFGVVVAEALAYGVPVISTFGSPWQGLVDNNCGWWVRAEADALAGALIEAMSLSDEERYEMGLRGRLYARQFDWSEIARETANVYRWLLNMAECPDCVRLD